MRYLITFTDNRIGRNHSIEPMDVNVKGGDTTDLEILQTNLPDSLASAVHSYARPHLRSRDFDVDIEMSPDLLDGRGTIGWGRSGSFRIERMHS